jgi:hypothetical protein
MPTSLLTIKMSPALRRRVLASLRRRGAHSSAKEPTRRTLPIRSIIVVLVFFVAFAVIREQRTRSAEIQTAKENLLKARADLRKALPLRAAALGERIMKALSQEAGNYLGDIRHDSIRSLEDWERVANRPLLYARFDVQASVPNERLEGALAESRVDAVVHCLKTPPADRTEKELMKRVADAYAAAEPEFTQNVHRAADALLVVRMLEPSMDRELERAEDLETVVRFQQVWDEAGVDRKLPAVSAELLLVVIDEPKQPGTPVELDGASVHGVRVAAIDMSGERDVVLYRSHHDSNPEWVSERRRHQYAKQLESCRLAHDIRRGWQTDPIRR